MRVLFISNFYPPHDLGGWEQNCQEIAQRLQARGHTCHVLTSCYGVDGKSQVEEYVTRALHLEADIHYYRPLDFFLRHPIQEKQNQEAVKFTLENFKPDVVFIWGMWNLSPRVAYWAEQWMPERVAYAVAGYWPMQPETHEVYWKQPSSHYWAKALMAPARWWALRTIAKERRAHPLIMAQVSCVSEYVRQKLSKAGVLPHGARVIYNGVDPQPFLQTAAQRTVNPDLLRLVYAGGLVTHKGVHTAIEAMGLLQKKEKATGLHLHVVGGGHPDYEAYLEQRVKELDLGGCVTFHGRMPRSKIAEVLANHDVFLFTSVYEEPIARSVMEAMAATLAIIGTVVGGQGEILQDGVNALVYPADDAESLAACILRLQKDPYLRVQLAKAGQGTVLEHFTLDRMVNEMELWLKEIVG